METYKFTNNDKTYELGKKNCNYLLNAEEKPVIGIGVADILELLNQHEGIEFELEYYDLPCENCKHGLAEKAKYFNFLEYHFFILTKNEKYVVSTISKEYENTSFNKLIKKGLIDGSYIVSIMVCANCGDYSIEIEPCEL
jgi:hypothetical protein